MVTLDLHALFNGLADDVGLDPFTRKYCHRRINSEGIQFLTVTLPKLSKSVLASLEKGSKCVASSPKGFGSLTRPWIRPTSFAWKGRSLRHFQSLLKGIFGSDGRVLPDVDATSLWRLRQFCEYFYKLSLDFSQEQLEKAEQSFLRTEEELALLKLEPLYVDQLRKDLETYYPSLKGKPEDVLKKHRPRFGPGTFAGVKSIRSKYYQYKVSDATAATTDSFRGVTGFFKSYPASPQTVKIVHEPSNVTEILFVPKDSRGPRVIGREPLFNLSAQLSFFDFITAALEKDSRRRINFQDQSINRELAATSSKNKKHATIDLKEASDRVSHALVGRLVARIPTLAYFYKRRTRTAVLPSGRTVQLAKLAGMGSGLTFPIMSLLAHLTITRSIVDRTGRDYNSVRREVFTYGDDLVVPTGYYSIAVSALERVGLMVNNEKSYRFSHFRESCGGDYYNGNDVAPVRLKLSGSKLTVYGNTLKADGCLAPIQIERHCRELVKNGHLALSEYLYARLEKALGITLPELTGESPFLGRYTPFTPKGLIGENGCYKTVSGLLPVADVEKAPRMDPYGFLAQSLRPTENSFGHSSLELFPDGAGSAYGEVARPRQVKLITKRVSAIALQG